ncbi:Endonuclease/exonuclease/phosphatase, partial [Mycena polygramma]
MFDEKIGLMAVGETHITDEDIAEIEGANMGQRNRLQIFNSIDVDHPSKGGIAVVLNKDMTNTANVDVRRLIPGRAILVKIPWHGTLTLTVLAVYAPADSPAANKAFWNELCRLWLTENLPIPDVFLGDMNLVEESMDRLPHRADDPGATDALARFKRLLELKDGWRMTYPDTKKYTFSRKNGTHSRLDRINVSPTLFKNCRHWDISDAAGNITDHRLVTVTICAPGAPYIGPGRYAIPLFLMNDAKFMDFAVEAGVDMFETQDQEESDDLQTRFKRFKDRVAAFAKARASLTMGALEQKKLKLQAQRDKILNPTESDDE